MITRTPRRGRAPAVAALAMLLLACGDSSQHAPVAELPVRVATVAQKNVELFSEYVGEIVPSREVTLRARSGGFLLEQHVADGARVQEGELLFTVDGREASERRSAASAQLAGARARLAQAEGEVARYAPLVPEEAIAAQIYDNAIAARDAARAAVEAQEAMLRQADLAVSWAEVRAPLSGRMGAAGLAVGDLVAAGTTVLAEVSVDDPVWVYVALSETELLALEQRLRDRPDMSTEIAKSATLDLADGRRYDAPGRIDFLDRALDPVTGTYRVRVVFDNPEGRLLPGQFARVRLLTDRRPDSLLVPARAVEQVLDQAFVPVLTQEQTIERRPVELGIRLESEWIIEAGLQAGETIVVDGAGKVRPGMRVTPQPAAAP